MSRLKAFNPSRIQEVRKSSGFNQTDYWKRFGVTQSGGSRYETGRAIPMPTAMMLWLRDSGRINDQDLADALKAVKSSRR